MRGRIVTEDAPLPDLLDGLPAKDEESELTE